MYIKINISKIYFKNWRGISCYRLTVLMKKHFPCSPDNTSITLVSYMTVSYTHLDVYKRQ